jgi:hypothetical protein
VARADGEGGLVGPGDGRDDGQAEAKAVVASGPLGAQALERLEEPADLGGGDDGPGVGDREGGAAAVGCHVNAEVAAGQVVAQRVVDQVGGKLPEQAVVTKDGGGGQHGTDGHVAASGVRLAGAQDLCGDPGEVQGLAPVEAALAAGQGQQRVDQPFLLLSFGEHILACRAQRGGGSGRVGEGHLQHGPRRGQRGPQLMRGIGDEVPLCLEGCLQPGQQAVDRVSEVGELIARAGHREPAVQVVFGDLPGGGGDRSQRPQRPSGDDPAEHDRGPGHDRQAGRRRGQQPV